MSLTSAQQEVCNGDG